jgi:hypothetical protein
MSIREWQERPATRVLSSELVRKGPIQSTLRVLRTLVCANGIVPGRHVHEVFRGDTCTKNTHMYLQSVLKYIDVFGTISDSRAPNYALMPVRKQEPDTVLPYLAASYVSKR